MKHMTAKSMRKALKTKWIEQIYQKDSVDSTLTWAKEEAESSSFGKPEHGAFSGR